MRLSHTLIPLILFAAISPTLSWSANAPSVTVSPGATTVGVGQALQYNAAVTGESNATVRWYVNQIAGGNTTVGTISATGLYRAPSKLPAATSRKMTIMAVTADNKARNTSVATIAPDGPGISSITPNPLIPGKFTAVIHGTGFVPGAVVRNGSTNMQTHFVSATELTATGTQATSNNTYFQAANPGSAWGPPRTVLVAKPPIVTAAGVPSQIPLGAFTATISGANFIPGSWVAICSSSVPTTYVSPTKVMITGFCTHPGPTTLQVVSGNMISAPLVVKVGVVNPKVSPAAARRFLEQAAFGPTPYDASVVQSIGFSAWIDAQMAMPQQSTYKTVTQAYNGMPSHFMTNAVTKPDQLRQRVAFALSQIYVTSLVQLVNANMIPYQDMLLADAFSNYKQIMSDVTLSPAMGQYLNMANNAKADPTVGSLANENYARELMQLFTIGVNQLNPDGTAVLDSNGIPVPTYSQFNVTEFARVYTGWTYPPRPGAAVKWPGNLSNYGPMVPYPAEHDSGSKQLLNGFVSPAGLTQQADLANAINNIFNHPNVGPFVSTLLIKHLVKSNPSPAYVTRVAAAFNNNGSGVRGDMKAVIKAILLDPEARANDEGGSDQATDGHLQEPALFIAGMYRAFSGSLADNSNYQWYLSTIDQQVFYSPDVFNFYDWDYLVPGTTLQGGEFEINSPNNAIARANLVTSVFGTFASPIESGGPGSYINLTPYLYLAPSPARLVDALDLTLTHGTMPAAMKSIIVTAVTEETGGSLRRVQKGAYLILTSSYYNVWH